MSHIFTCLIEDRRYNVPTLRLLEAEGDVASLQALAHTELLASEDHLAVEVFAEGGLVLWREARTEGRR